MLVFYLLRRKCENISCLSARCIYFAEIGQYNLIVNRMSRRSYEEAGDMKSTTIRVSQAMYSKWPWLISGVSLILFLVTVLVSVFGNRDSAEKSRLRDELRSE